MASIWKYVKRIALGLAVVILLLLIWGVGIEPRLVDYKEEVAVIPNLPPAWEEKRVAPLALAGHTHGGQLRLPFMSQWSWMALVSDEKIYADGWINGFGKSGNRLYVNRGIGFSLIPARVNCLPELTFFTLHRHR